MTQHEVLQIFRDTGALLEGHFILRSGLHSRQYFQCALALQQMPVVEKIGAAFAAKVKASGAVTVVSPAMGDSSSARKSPGNSACDSSFRKKKTANSFCGADSKSRPAKKCSSLRT